MNYALFYLRNDKFLSPGCHWLHFFDDSNSKLLEITILQ